MAAALRRREAAALARQRAAGSLFEGATKTVVDSAYPSASGVISGARSNIGPDSGCGKNVFVISISGCGHGAAAVRVGPDRAGPNCDDDFYMNSVSIGCQPECKF